LIFQLLPFGLFSKVIVFLSHFDQPGSASRVSGAFCFGARLS